MFSGFILDVGVLTEHTEQALRHSNNFTEGRKGCCVLFKSFYHRCYLFCLIQEYSEWKKGAADVCLPTAHINRMEHLNAFIQVVMATTQELSDLIICSYKEKLNSMLKSGTLNEQKLKLLLLKCV